MKKFLSIGLILCFLAIISSAVAESYTQKTWEQRCRSKLGSDTILYNVVFNEITYEVISSTPIGTVSKGTYIASGKWSSDYKMCEIYYYINGAEHSGWIYSNSIVSALRILWFTDGSYSQVPEALTFDISATYEWINRMAPGHTLYAISTTDQGNPLYYDYDPAKVKIIGSKPEATQAPATEAPVPVGTPIPGSTETAAPGVSTATLKPGTTPKPNATAKPNSTASVKHTAAPTRVPTAEDYTLKQLGTVTTLVAWQGKSFEIATVELFAASTVPPEQQLAIIYAPKEGTAALRRSASTSAYLTRHCKAGYLVKVLEYGKKFCKVIYDGDTGYVLTSSLRFITPGTEPDARALISVNGRTNGATYVNVRCAPDKNSAKVAEWDTGTEVLIYGEQNGWYQIEARGRRGWVLEKFLTVTD